MALKRKSPLERLLIAHPILHLVAWILSPTILFDDKLSADFSLCAYLGRKRNVGGLKAALSFQGQEEIN